MPIMHKFDEIIQSISDSIEGQRYLDIGVSNRIQVINLSIKGGRQELTDGFWLDSDNVPLVIAALAIAYKKVRGEDLPTIKLTSPVTHTPKPDTSYEIIKVILNRTRIKLLEQSHSNLVALADMLGRDEMVKAFEGNRLTVESEEDDDNEAYTNKEND